MSFRPISWRAPCFFFYQIDVYSFFQYFQILKKNLNLYFRGPRKQVYYNLCNANQVCINRYRVHHVYAYSYSYFSNNDNNLITTQLIQWALSIYSSKYWRKSFYLESCKMSLKLIFKKNLKIQRKLVVRQMHKKLKWQK